MTSIKTKYAWNIQEAYDKNGRIENRYVADIDNSHSNGCLHFTHEISIVFDFRDGELKFISASEIACDYCEYDNAADFELFNPGMLEDLAQYMLSLGNKTSK